MNEAAEPGSAFLREKVEGCLACHPDGDPEGLCRRVGFFYYPREKVIDGDDGRSGKGTDFCSRVTEIVQSCHIEGTASDHTSFCNHPDQVYGSERDNKSRSIRIFKVNDLFCHSCIMIVCNGPANNGTGINVETLPAGFWGRAVALDRRNGKLLPGDRGLMT